jgi:hypothetical protein
VIISALDECDVGFGFGEREAFGKKGDEALLRAHNTTHMRQREKMRSNAACACVRVCVRTTTGQRSMGWLRIISSPKMTICAAREGERGARKGTRSGVFRQRMAKRVSEEA